LLVREFRTATRFTRPNADATLAIVKFVEGNISKEEAILSVRADLLDTYQARLSEALRALKIADASEYPIRRAELAALAEGYFLILAPSFLEQRGIQSYEKVWKEFADLRTAAIDGSSKDSNFDLASLIDQIEADLQDFRAAPLSPAEQARAVPAN
jgi:high-affinity iron transporter